MKIYLISECDSYGKREIVATTTSKKKATEWLMTMNLKDYARNRITREFDYDILPLNKNNITSYSFFVEKSINYYIVDEYTTF